MSDISTHAVVQNVFVDPKLVLPCSGTVLPSLAQTPTGATLGDRASPIMAHLQMLSINAVAAEATGEIGSVVIVQLIWDPLSSVLETAFLQCCPDHAMYLFSYRCWSLVNHDNGMQAACFGAAGTGRTYGCAIRPWSP